ncbi:MAG: cysteine desulfurase family protein [bacterium]|nr:cysteine desulfurase family protein [bacterium]
MIYLDYSATTPVDQDIFKEYIKNTLLFSGNPNSQHQLGKFCKSKIDYAIASVCRVFNCDSDELIFTSCASESNATAIRGIANSFNTAGKHIITSKLEHRSILKEVERLTTLGYEVEYVNILKNGQVDLIDLENKIREDTILISICGVNSEVGYKQDLYKIREVINKKNNKVIFHSDLTQALGKINIDLTPLDMASFSSHKVYAPIGCGLLYKRKNIEIDPLICSTNDNSLFRGGTRALPLIVAFCESIKKYNNNIENQNKCISLNKLIIDRLSKYDIQINSNEYCIPHIINFSLLRMKSLDFVRYLDKEKILVSSTTACCSKKESIILKELYKDENIYKTSIRLSISHLTTIEQIDKFFKVFDEIYQKHLK